MFNKIAGLLSLTVLGSAFILGPLSYFFPVKFSSLKHYRRYLGISGKDINFMLFDPTNEHRLGVYAGLTALGIFFLMTVTSNTKAVQLLGYKWWKVLQTIGYVALALNILHFFLMETEKGVFTIRRPLGKVIFVFGFVVLFFRLVVFVATVRKKGDSNGGL